MARSQEEKDAIDRIEAAIEYFRKAFRESHPEAGQGTLTDWIVVATEVQPDMNDPDEDLTAYSIIMSGGGIPWYRARGLLQAGIAFMDNPTND